jgi:putative membrane protein
MHPIPCTLGMLTLGAAWLGPLPAMAAQSFAAHMAMHMMVVAIAAPLLAAGVTGSAFDPAHAQPHLFSPIPASMIELVVVWSWHAPFLHQAARHDVVPLVLEQSMFLAASLLLWLSALSENHPGDRHRAGAGILALLFTSMHMTLLGALFSLAPRPLYPHPAGVIAGLSSLADQHVGGAIMLIVGGASYLAAGLWLTAGLLRDRPEPGRGGPTAVPIRKTP